MGPAWMSADRHACRQSKNGPRAQSSQKFIRRFVVVVILHGQLAELNFIAWHLRLAGCRARSGLLETDSHLVGTLWLVFSNQLLRAAASEPALAARGTKVVGQSGRRGREEIRGGNCTIMPTEMATETTAATTTTIISTTTTTTTN